MVDHVIISRDQGVPISLDEWMRFLAGSAVVRPVAPREGISPFTREPATFHPVPGAATFSTGAGDCSVSYQDGALVVTGPLDDGMSTVRAIARSLDASVTEAE